MQGSYRIIPKGEFSDLRGWTIPSLISTALNLVLITAVVLFFFQFLLGGIKMILSGGNKERVDKAKRQLVNAVVGLLIVILSWTIMGLVESTFGINLMTFQIPRIQTY